MKQCLHVSVYWVRQISELKIFVNTWHVTWYLENKHHQPRPKFVETKNNINFVLGSLLQNKTVRNAFEYWTIFILNEDFLVVQEL